jgi:hypothetical protein
VALRVEGNQEDSITAKLLEMNISRIQRIKRRSRREFILSTHIDDYEIRDVMLDLGFDINIFPKKTLEVMGKPYLVYSLI